MYSSYDTTVTVPGRAAPIAVAAESAALYGTFTAPTSMAQNLGGLAGQGTFQAVVTDGPQGLGFSGGITYTFTDPLYLTGGPAATQPSLSVSDVELTVDYGGGDLEIDLTADGSYFTPAATDGSTPADTVPLSVGVDVDLTSPTFGFTATAAGGNPVQSAFGQQGLTLDNLAIAGSIGTSDSLGLAASADVPTSWTGSLGIQPNTPVSLVIDISDTPCLQFSVGQNGSTTEAIDFMNEGVLIADYANVLLAPLGCQFADVDIAPGFALDFDGVISGDPIDFNSQLDLDSGGFAVKASLFIGEFELGGATLTDSTFDLDLDPSADVFEIGFGSTVTVGDSSLAVQGSYGQSGPNTVTANFQAASQGNVTIAGFGFDNADVDFTYQRTGTQSSLSFQLTGDVSFLDQSLDGTLALTTQNGSVVTASGNFSVNVDLAIASVQDPLQFSYTANQGASGTFGPGSVSVVGLDFSNVTGSLQPNGDYSVQAYLPIPAQEATAADTWLYLNEGGDFDTSFAGTLGITLTGGPGQSVSLGYDGSSVGVWSRWAEHSWSDWGSWVQQPQAGCPAPTVSGDGVGGTPDVSLWLNPVAVEQASTGDSDDDDNYCLAFSSQIIP